MASNLVKVWGMSNQVMKVDIFIVFLQRYPKRFFVLLSQNLDAAKKWCHSYPNMAILSKLNKMIMMMKVSRFSSWFKVLLLNSSCCGQYTYLFNLNIYLPFDVCSLHIVDIVMFGSARWPSSHYWSFFCIAWKYSILGGHLHFSLASFSFLRGAKDSQAVVATITILS